LTSRRALALTSLLTIGALGLAGCSNAADGPAPQSDEQPQAQEQEPTEQGLAFTREDLGDLPDDVFGDVVWAHELGSTHDGSVAKIVKLEHAWRRLDGRNDDGFQVAPFPG